KVGKEEIIGMVKALELYLKEDHDALEREWQARLERVSRELTKIPGVSTSFFVPDIANHVPHMQITWNSKVSVEPHQVSQLLRNSKPAIVIGGGEGRPGAHHVLVHVAARRRQDRRRPTVARFARALHIACLQ